MAIGDDILARLRQLAGRATLRDLEVRWGAPFTTIGKYLRGRVPPAEFLAEVCRRTGTSADWLLLGREPDARTAEVVRLADVDPEQAAAEAALRRLWRYGTGEQRAAVSVLLRTMDPGEKKERHGDEGADPGIAGGVA